MASDTICPDTLFRASGGDPMKVHFVGCSNANPNPGFGQAGLLIETHGRLYLFDCGDGVPTKLWLEPGLDWSGFTAVFVTHLHADHVGGLLVLMQLLHQRAKSHPEWPIGRAGVLEIYLPDPLLADLFEELVELTHPVCFAWAFKPYAGEGVIYRDDRLTVESRPSAHGAAAHAFRITAEDRRIVYSGDLAAPAEIADLCDRADLVVMEGAHFPLEDIPPALAGRGIQSVALNHLADDRIADPDGSLAAVADLAAETDLFLARDGMVVAL